MQHPFTAVLAKEQLATVSGAAASTPHPGQIRGQLLGPTPAPIKPKIGSTMAIGEEGGGFWF